MSHFSTVRTKIKSQSALTAGLQAFFLQHRIFVPVHSLESPILLRNSYATSNTRHAHVVLKREDLSRNGQKVYLDIGFERVGEEDFVLHADEWDLPHTVLADILNPQPTLVAALQLEAQKYHALEYMKEKFAGWEQVDTTLLPDGTIRGVLKKKQDMCQPVGVSAVL